MSIFIIFAGLLFRMAGIFRPLIGNFATKNIVYAMIAKNFSLSPGTLFYPTLDFLVNGKKALHMTEWPFFAYFIGGIYRIVPGITIDVMGRGFAGIFFTLSAVFFYRFCRRNFSIKFSLYALMFYMFFPIGIIYGQVFQMEAAMMLCIEGMIDYSDLWIKEKGSFFRAVMIWLFISLLLLMKIQLLCLFFPIVVLLLSEEKGRKLFKHPGLYLFSIACLVLPFYWYFHTFRVALTHDNVFFSILYSMKIRQFPDPRLFTVVFYLQVLKTMIKETFSPAGFVMLVFGVLSLIKSKNRVKYVVLAYLFAMLVYTLALPRKMFEMNYYFVPLIFPGAIMAAYGIRALRTRSIRIFIVFLFLFGSIAIAYRPSFTPFPDPGKFYGFFDEVNENIPENSRIIVSSSKITSGGMLYYLGHEGWGFYPEGSRLKDIEVNARRKLNMGLSDSRYYPPQALFEKYITEGAEYYVCDDVEYLKNLNSSFYEHLTDRYKIVKEKDYLILELKGK